MPTKAVENEVAKYTARRAHLRDEQGHRVVVRDGHLPGWHGWADRRAGGGQGAAGAVYWWAVAWWGVKARGLSGCSHGGLSRGGKGERHDE